MVMLFEKQYYERQRTPVLTIPGLTDSLPPAQACQYHVKGSGYYNRFRGMCSGQGSGFSDSEISPTVRHDFQIDSGGTSHDSDGRFNVDDLFSGSRS